MLWTIIGVLVVLWILGFSLNIGGGLIHALIVVALVLFVFNLISGRRPHKATIAGRVGLVGPLDTVKTNPACSSEILQAGYEGKYVMSNGTMASVNRSQLHTEVRSPIETVLSRVVWFVFGVIEILIAIRFVLTLLGANAEAGFVNFIYTVSDVFMAPFNAIFSTGRVSGATIEWSALVAIAVYALIAWGLVALIGA